MASFSGYAVPPPLIDSAIYNSADFVNTSAYLTYQTAIGTFVTYNTSTPIVSSSSIYCAELVTPNFNPASISTSNITAAVITATSSVNTATLSATTSITAPTITASSSISAPTVLASTSITTPTITTTNAFVTNITSTSITNSSNISTNTLTVENPA